MGSSPGAEGFCEVLLLVDERPAALAVFARPRRTSAREGIVAENIFLRVPTVGEGA
jgi:hypothetical protein